MSRGENPEFRERVGVLSMPLKRKNVKSKIEANWMINTDKIDIEAYLTEDETFNEIWCTIENILEKADRRTYENVTKSEVEAEIEKYEALREEVMAEWKGKENAGNLN